MTDQTPPALPPPMTVGRYVRENFKRFAFGYFGWATIAAPASVAVKTQGGPFSWVERIVLIVLTLAGSVALVAALVVICLGIVGWWKLHTRINPYIPVTIAMVAAVLGYILVFNFY
jgi:hypothetical protein